jgi:hypothetical protein
MYCTLAGSITSTLSERLYLAFSRPALVLVAWSIRDAYKNALTPSGPEIDDSYGSSS